MVICLRHYISWKTGIAKIVNYVVCRESNDSKVLV
jgi:hypothetical protein